MRLICRWQHVIRAGTASAGCQCSKLPNEPKARRRTRTGERTKGSELRLLHPRTTGTEITKRTQAGSGKANTWEKEGLHSRKSNQGNGSRAGMRRRVAEKRANKTRMGRVTRQGRRFTHYRPVQIVCRFVSQAKRSVNVGQPGRAISHNAFSGALLREDENTSRRSAASRKGLIGIYPTSFRKAAVHGRNLLQPDLRPSFGHFCAGIESDSTMCGLPSVVRG